MYSWHSFRIWLACALKRAGVSDADTQLLLRWKSSASLHAYQRMSQEVQAQLLTSALEVGDKIDVRQASNLPELDDYRLARALEGLAMGVEKMPEE